MASKKKSFTFIGSIVYLIDKGWTRARIAGLIDRDRRMISHYLLGNYFPPVEDQQTVIKAAQMLEESLRPVKPRINQKRFREAMSHKTHREFAAVLREFVGPDKLVPHEYAAGVMSVHPRTIYNYKKGKPVGIYDRRRDMLNAINHFNR